MYMSVQSGVKQNHCSVFFILSFIFEKIVEKCLLYCVDFWKKICTDCVFEKTGRQLSSSR